MRLTVVPQIQFLAAVIVSTEGSPGERNLPGQFRKLALRVGGAGDGQPAAGCFLSIRSRGAARRFGRLDLPVEKALFHARGGKNHSVSHI